MSNIIVHRRKGAITSVEASTGEADDSRVCWQSNHPDKTDSLILKFKSGGEWYYQWVVWSCRGGKQHYYRALVALYRFLRKEGLVAPKSLRRIADGGDILELRLNGTPILRGADTVVELAFRQITNPMYAEGNADKFQQHRQHWRKKTGVPLWEGKLELYKLRTAYRNTPWSKPWMDAVVEDESVDIMDTEAIKRIRQGAKYGNALWASTAAALLKRRFGSDDPDIILDLLARSDQEQPGTRGDWIRRQVEKLVGGATLMHA